MFGFRKAHATMGEGSRYNGRNALTLEVGDLELRPGCISQLQYIGNGICFRVGEMAQWLRAHVVLAEDS